MNRKDKSEPKTLTITPSENTHFRVILSTEAMEEESRDGQRATDPVCSIVKPEPRTLKMDHHKPQPPEASPHDTNPLKHEPDHSGIMSGGFSSESSPTDDLSPKVTHKTRWKSSPPSRRDSGSAAGGGGDSAAASPKADSPTKRRGKTTSYLTSSENNQGINLLNKQ